MIKIIIMALLILVITLPPRRNNSSDSDNKKQGGRVDKNKDYSLDKGKDLDPIDGATEPADKEDSAGSEGPIKGSDATTASGAGSVSSEGGSETNVATDAAGGSESGDATTQVALDGGSDRTTSSGGSTAAEAIIDGSMPTSDSNANAQGGSRGEIGAANATHQNVIGSAPSGTSTGKTAETNGAASGTSAGKTAGTSGGASGTGSGASGTDSGASGIGVGKSVSGSGGDGTSAATTGTGKAGSGTSAVGGASAISGWASSETNEPNNGVSASAGVSSTEKPPMATTSSSITAVKANLFAVTGEVKNKSSYGFWLQLCNDSYLFGNRLNNWKQNHDTCCSLGMKPFYILNETDNDCLQHFINTSWFYNYNYWSGGTKNQSSDAVWCPLSNNTPSSVLKWETDKKENHHCMKMKISNNKTETPWQMVWTFKNCSTMSLLACKAPITTTPPPKCPKWKRDQSLFKGPNSSLKDPQNYGNWFHEYNHTFLLGLPANWSYAHKQCGRLGMKLVSFNNPQLMEYLRSLTKKYSAFANRTYWSSGYDKRGAGKYNWCTADDIPVENINWKDGKAGSTEGCVRVFYPRIPKPTKKTESNSNSNEAVTTTESPPGVGRRRRRQAPGGPAAELATPLPSESRTSVTSNSVVAGSTTFETKTTTASSKSEDESAYKGYFDVYDCDRNQSFICVAKSMRTPKQKQQECMAAFKITQKEIDTLLTMTSYTKEIKCFLRCMGEELNILFEGLPADIDLLKLVEETASNDPELDKHIDILNVCSKETGADACETAAKVFKCGVDKDAAGMTNLIETSSANAAKEASPLVGPTLATCDLIDCTIDPLLTTKRSLKQNDPLTKSYFVTACGKVYYISTGVNGPGYEMAHKYCCKLGMTLAIFDTAEEANCVASAIQDPFNLERILPGFLIPFRLFGTNKDNANFPVWCPERSPVDMMLFYPLFYTPEFDAIAVTISGTHPVPPPLFSAVDKTSSIHFICEDLD